MNKAERIELFKKQLALFDNPVYRDCAIVVIEAFPEYFFEVPASTSGRYHPQYALGEGGLVRHTKAAMYFARFMLELEQSTFNPIEKNTIFLALLAHDGWKQGEGGKYLVEHPIEAAEQVQALLIDMLNEEQLEVLYRAIASHMGQWNLDYATKKAILPKPSCNVSKFVHVCDYLASRKQLEFNFEV